MDEAETRGLTDTETRQLLFGDDFEQYEQDRADALEDLKDNDGHQQIVTKATKKFSDMVNICYHLGL